MALWNLTYTGQYAAANVKMLLLQFSSDVSQILCGHISWHGGIQAIPFFDNRPSFTDFVSLWNCNMGVNGICSLKCEISRKWLVVERNGRKFGTWDPTVDICRVLLMPHSLSLVWGHSVHFAKFPILWFSKPSTVFIRFQPNFILSIIIRGYYFFLRSAKIKNFMALWNLCYQAGSFKTLLLQFSSDVSRILWGHWLPWGNAALLLLAIGQVLQNLWHFEILTLKSMGKPKIWIISKTADCRAKWTKIWDSGY